MTRIINKDKNSCYHNTKTTTKTIIITTIQQLKWLSRLKQKVIKKHLFLNEHSTYIKMNWNVKIHMVSRNSIYPLPRDGTFSAHINGDHNHVSRYKSYYQKDKLGWIGEKSLLRRNAQPKHPRYNISAKQDLPLPESRCFRATVIQCDYKWNLTLITC